METWVSELPAELFGLIYWDNEDKQLEPLIKQHISAVGTEFYRSYKLIGEFARNTSNMLERLANKL